MSIHKTKSTVFLVLLSILTLSCGSNKNPFFFEDDFTTVPEPYSTAGITPVQHSNGLTEYVLKEGTGGFTVDNRDEVLVHYTGRKTNGDVFDSSFKNGRTTPAQLQVTGVIEGFRLGLLNMKEGGKKVLVIPPALGYEGSGNELSADTLIFDIELHTILN